jgi:phosphopantetheine adenylyltransferase
MKDEEVTMHYKTFDTHKYIKSLQESGFNEKQAEMLVKSLLESRDFDLSILATREQISEVKIEIAQLDSKFSKEISTIREQVSEVKSDLQKDIATTRQDVAEVKSELQQEIAATRDEIKQSKVDMLKWMLPLMSTMMAMMLAIIVKLFL